MSIRAHDSDVNAVCFVDETTQILASGSNTLSYVSLMKLPKSLLQVQTHLMFLLPHNIIFFSRSF